MLAAFADHIYQQVKQVDLRKLASQPTIPGPVSWGGACNGIYLTNTCPLDNFLAIFWAAVHNSEMVSKILRG